MSRTIAAPNLGKGDKTRQSILTAAADIASAEGLNGLTIGKLASTLGMSKSGLYAHFDSKEDLQLAVVDVARTNFERSVEPPTLDASAGLPKLMALLTSWADSIDHTNYRGGCFFAAAAAEFDGRPGAVRDAIARLSKAWINRLSDEAVTAQNEGHFKKSTDVRQLVFEVHAFVQEANWAKQLLDDKQAFKRAKRAIRGCLENVATAKGARLLHA